MMIGSLAVSLSTRWSQMDRSVVERRGLNLVSCPRERRALKADKNAVGAADGCESGRMNGVPSLFLYSW
jgi:hypothetical protein